MSEAQGWDLQEWAETWESWLCVAGLLTWNSRQLGGPGEKGGKTAGRCGICVIWYRWDPSSGRMHAIDKLSIYCVQLYADQMALERPLGRGVQSERESSRSCGLWLLVVGLGPIPRQGVVSDGK